MYFVHQEIGLFPNDFQVHAKKCYDIFGECMKCFTYTAHSRFHVTVTIQVLIFNQYMLKSINVTEI